MGVIKKVGPFKPGTHTRWVADVLKNDNPKLVRICCVIEEFWRLCVGALIVKSDCWYSGFCQKDLVSSLFLSILI